jgi:hypothetical protein
MPSLRLLRVALILVAILLPPAALPLAAAPLDAFAIRGVDVDVTANSVAAAKDQALLEAERVAFRRLLERLTVAADQARLPNADAVQYVRDVAIEQERSSAVRYIATITVRFNQAAVKKLLRDAGIKYAEARPRAVVVVPVFKAQGAARPVLWDDPNPWRGAWSAVGSGGLVPLVVPTGDLADVAAVTAEQALSGDAERLDALASRFRTRDVLVAAAAVNPAGNQLDVSLNAPPGVPKPFETRSYAASDGNLDTLLRQAAFDIVQGMDTAYKQQNLLSFDRAASLSTMVPLTGIEDWLGVRERLSRVPQVRGYEIVSLSRGEAALVLHTVGDQEQVKAALASAGLSLEWGDGLWTMRLGSRR